MDWTTMFNDDADQACRSSEMQTAVSEQITETNSIPDKKQQTQNIVEIAHGAVVDNSDSRGRYKRGRGRSFFSEPPKKGSICQVPGCDRPLHKLKDYYKRYKICPYHLELSQLVVEGQSIRFCQQCGRFQLLDDFDGDRRSCRRKLEKHNERRRRYEGGSDSGDIPELQALSGKKHRHVAGAAHMEHENPEGTNPPGFEHQSLYQGLSADPELQQVLHSRMMEGLNMATNKAGGAWTRVQPSTLPQHTQQQVPIVPSYPMPQPGGSSFTALNPALAAVLQQADGAGGRHGAMNEIGPSSSHQHHENHQAMHGSYTLNGEYHQQQQQQRQQPEQPKAQLPTEAGTMTLLQALLDQVQHLTTASIANGDGPGSKSPAPSTVTGQDGHIQPMDDSSAGGGMSAFGFAGTGGAHNSLETTASGALGDPSTAMAATMNAGAGVVASSQAHGGQVQQQQQPAAQAALYGNENPSGDLATAHQLLSLISQLVQNQAPAQAAFSEQHITTVCMKLFQTSPPQLPPQVLQEVTTWMMDNPTYMEVVNRPGCVVVTAVALMTLEEQQALGRGFKTTLETALANPECPLGGPRTGGDMLVQLLPGAGIPVGQAAVVKGSKLVAMLSLEEELRSRVTAIRPSAAEPDYEGPIVLFTAGSTSSDTENLVCRSHGLHPVLEVLENGDVYLPTGAGLARNGAASAAGTSASVSHDAGTSAPSAVSSPYEVEEASVVSSGLRWMHVCIPEGLEPGAYQFELQRESMLSPAISLAVVPNAEAVTELRQLETNPWGVNNVPEFLHKVGLVVKATDRLTGAAQPAFTAVEAARLASAAADIAALCLLRGWTALLQLIQPATLPTAVQCLSVLEQQEQTVQLARGILSRLGMPHSSSPECDYSVTATATITTASQQQEVQEEGVAWRRFGSGTSTSSCFRTCADDCFELEEEHGGADDNERGSRSHSPRGIAELLVGANSVCTSFGGLSPLGSKELLYREGSCSPSTSTSGGGTPSYCPPTSLVDRSLCALEKAAEPSSYEYSTAGGVEEEEKQAFGGEVELPERAWSKLNSYAVTTPITTTGSGGSSGSILSVNAAVAVSSVSSESLSVGASNPRLDNRMRRPPSIKTVVTEWAVLFSGIYLFSQGLVRWCTPRAAGNAAGRWSGMGAVAAGLFAALVMLLNYSVCIAPRKLAVSSFLICLSLWFLNPVSTLCPISSVLPILFLVAFIHAWTTKQDIWEQFCITVSGTVIGGTHHVTRAEHDLGLASVKGVAAGNTTSGMRGCTAEVGGMEGGKEGHAGCVGKACCIAEE